MLNIDLFDYAELIIVSIITIYAALAYCDHKVGVAADGFILVSSIWPISITQFLKQSSPSVLAYYYFLHCIVRPNFEGG
jgi:hypothetical protein